MKQGYLFVYEMHKVSVFNYIFILDNLWMKRRQL